MGLVKTRRLAAMQKARLRGGFGAASSTKAGMKPPVVKCGARKGDGVFWLRDGRKTKGKDY